MSDPTQKSVSFPIVPNPNDKRPLPEIVADYCGFPLAYVDADDGKRYYAVIDWIRGVAQPADAYGIAEPKHASNYWASMKRRLKKAGIEPSAQFCKLPYTARDGKRYQRDYGDANSLNMVANYMSLSTGVISLILTGKSYNAKSRNMGYVYLIGFREIPDQYKIGFTRAINRRLYDLSTLVPGTFYLLHSIETSFPKVVERTLHQMFDSKKTIGEWYKLSTTDIDFIRRLNSANIREMLNI